MQYSQETEVRSLGKEDALEKEMASRSSILAWKISRTEETCGLQSMGSQRAVTTESLSTHTHTLEGKGKKITTFSANCALVGLG